MINASKQLYKLKNIYNSNCQKNENENEKYVKVDAIFRRIFFQEEKQIF